MTRESKSQEISKLLQQGKPSREVINLGYKPGTVYKVQREFRARRHGAREDSSEKKKTASMALRPQNRGANRDEGIESDPEILQLKKEIRKAQLHKELARLKAETDLDLEALLVAAKDMGAARKACCPLLTEGDLCSYHSWERETDAPKGVGELVEGNGFCGIKPSPLYCAFCIATERLELDDIIRRLSDGE